jgi:hypothetical protein
VIGYGEIFTSRVGGSFSPGSSAGVSLRFEMDQMFELLASVDIKLDTLEKFVQNLLLNATMKNDGYDEPK